MNQTSVSFDNQLARTMALPKKTFGRDAKELVVTPFYKMFENEKGVDKSEKAEVPDHENLDENHLIEDTQSFLELEGLEDIEGAFELLNNLIMHSQEDMTNIGFVQHLLGSNPSETIKNALSSVDRILDSDVPLREFHFTVLPPAAEEMRTLKGFLKNGLAASFEGLTNEEKKAFLTLLNFGKLVVMSNEHIRSNPQVAEDVNQLATLLSKWKAKLSFVNETKPAESTEFLRGTSSMKEIAQKLYDQQSGNVSLKSKFGSSIFGPIAHQGKSNDLPLNQTVMIGELQWQTQQKSPVLALEKGGQTVGADEFIKTFESILSKANYTNLNGVQRLFVKLAPENLGTLQIELVQKDGQMVAKIIANTLKGKELLESHLQGLKITLASQGIQFDKIDFKQLAETYSQGEFSSEERQNQGENQNEPDHEKGHQEEESFSGFSIVLEDSMINQEV